MAREKNTARAAARRRTRIVARETREADDADFEPTPLVDPQPQTARSVLGFRVPNIREDIAQLPDMFRGKPLLWLPFVLLLVSFAIATFVPVNLLEPSWATIISFAVQWFFIPTGLATFLVAGFLAPRASYLVGFLVGVLNSVLLVIFATVKSDDVLTGTDPSQAQAGLVMLIMYALTIGPLAAAFAAWYRGFLNRMGANSRARAADREAEAKKKAREERRAARRPV